MAAPCLEGRYQFVKHIGKGCYGIVDKYWDLATRQYVAIKTMAYKDTEVQAFEQLNRLGAPRHLIMLPSDTFVLDSKRMMVFELMEGDLEALWKRSKTLNPEARLNLLCQVTFQVLQGLKWLHLHGLVHGDLKPANVLTKGNLCKLGDFGMSRNVASMYQGDKFGSIFYLAPEMLLETPLTTAIDIWTLGLLLFELYAGDYLFKGKSLADIQAAHAQFFSHHSQAHLQSLLPTASPQFVDLLSRMLHQDPLHRVTASTALEHPWFSNLQLRPIWASTVSPVSISQSHQPAPTYPLPSAEPDAPYMATINSGFSVPQIAAPRQGECITASAKQTDGTDATAVAATASVSNVTSPPRTPPPTPPRLDFQRMLPADQTSVSPTGSSKLLRPAAPVAGDGAKGDTDEHTGCASVAAAAVHLAVPLPSSGPQSPETLCSDTLAGMTISLSDHSLEPETDRKTVHRIPGRIFTSSEESISLPNTSFDTDSGLQDEGLASGCHSSCPAPEETAVGEAPGKKPGHRRQRSKDFMYKLLPSAMRQRYRTLDNTKI